MRKRVFCFAISVLTLTAVPLLAATIPAANTYSNLATWQSAVGAGNATELNFGNVSNGSVTPYPLGSFSFSGAGMTEENQAFQASAIDITSSVTVTAVILWVDVPSGDNATSFSLTLSDGETSGPVPITTDSRNRSAVFYGFTDTTGISSINVTGDGIFTIGDLWYSTAGLTGGSPPPPNQPPPSTPTSEAATYILTCGGLLLLFSLGRKLPPKQAV